VPGYASVQRKIETEKLPQFVFNPTIKVTWCNRSEGVEDYTIRSNSPCYTRFRVLFPGLPPSHCGGSGSQVCFKGVRELLSAQGRGAAVIERTSKFASHLSHIA
jgi:hypothetical protein